MVSVGCVLYNINNKNIFDSASIDTIIYLYWMFFDILWITWLENVFSMGCINKVIVKYYCILQEKCWGLGSIIQNKNSSLCEWTGPHWLFESVSKLHLADSLPQLVYIGRPPT